MDKSLNQILSRRRALKSAGLAATVAAASAAVTTNANAVHHSAADLDILNFALNLEYLEAEFYNVAVTGSPLPTSITGAPMGNVMGGSMVQFVDRASYLFAKEIADDELSHVLFLQSAIANAGGVAVTEPKIDLVKSFDTAAMAAGLGATFNPFADPNSFLLGAFIFEDVGVSAYAGAAGLLSRAYVTPAAQILAVEAYHAGEIRTRLYLGGYQIQANKIAAARAALSGKSDDVGIVTNGQITIVDAHVTGPLTGLAFTRTTTQVLNIVYLGGAVGTGGGFFPSGLNGTIR